MSERSRPKKLTVFLFCLCLALALNLIYFLLIKANPSATVTFTADTILSLSGITDGDLYIASGSECTSLNVSGSTLTATIPSGSTFTLKTATHDSALSLTPSGGSIDLTFSSGSLSSGHITSWTLDSSAGATVSHTVGMPSADTWYMVKTNGLNWRGFHSGGSIGFDYDGGLTTSKTFTYEQTGVGGGLPPGSSNPPAAPTEGFKLIINNGAETADNRTVTLKLYGGADTARIAVSEDPDFQYASQEDYTPTDEGYMIKTWALSENEGTKTIYVKFYTRYGVASETVSDTITLTILGAQTAGLADGDLIRNPNAQGMAQFDIYIVKLVGSKKFKRLIISPHVFESYGHFDKNNDGSPWDDIILADQATVDSFNTSDLSRAIGDTRIYQLIPNGDTGEKRWIKTQEAFSNLGYDWNSVYTINETDRDAYVSGEVIE